ncbi:DUF2975 domain-containing protein [Rufibacter tibetensis]|uniref:DUF2975 domain-containing protein n=1 Tax=Rufibacter tibetensis TaxID=512763 RepID=A0A0N7HWC0_9BACT|nr:DUF2975 domain-containing protein [Rufibacter tibetensis]ALI98824.1 hypothetical protein DC20_07355 [Rufibacter tibetensis]
MDKNLLLDIALRGGKTFTRLMLLVLVLYIGVFVHWHIRPEAYKTVVVSPDHNSVRFFKSDGEELPSTDDVANKKRTGFNIDIPSSIGKEIYLDQEISLGSISRFSLYVLSLQFVVGLGLLLLIVRELMNVIRAVQSVQTFHSKSVEAFRKIGFLCLGLALINGFWFLDAEGISRMGFSLKMTPLLFMLGAFIMAEIFKEGNKLYEQDQLTI